MPAGVGLSGCLLPGLLSGLLLSGLRADAGGLDGDGATLLALLRSGDGDLEDAILVAGGGLFGVGPFGERDGSGEGAVLTFGALDATVVLLALGAALAFEDEGVVGDLHLDVAGGDAGQLALDDEVALALGDLDGGDRRRVPPPPS